MFIAYDDKQIDRKEHKVITQSMQSFVNFAYFFFATFAVNLLFVFGKMLFFLGFIY
jgi:hypothetical protein